MNTAMYTPGDPDTPELQALEECVNIVARAKKLEDDLIADCDKQQDVTDRKPYASPADHVVMLPRSLAANEALVQALCGRALRPPSHAPTEAAEPHAVDHRQCTRERAGVQ